ncbi:hypothetical protein MMIC_P0204 [Mariprofundus micogutta]|uniref:Urease accessory protein UreH-like transmembrane domain-containing protein n=2 Tax=Mariprofundus micogutta TaxID=1921010 RepID=A0A1L8CK52_9PROT|nr:hypothetical protein MMIC_P0204 [Mariprofundus micogutta]
METILIAFSVGFLGSMHCIGMCGGLVSALSMTRPRVWWSGLSAYQFGRIITYSILGLISGWIGTSLKQIGGFDQVQFVLTLLAGLIMITFGLNLAGWMADPLSRISTRAIGGLGLVRRIKSAASKSTPVSWFGIGLANGLLPCGLVYAAIGLSIASGGIAEAGLSMFAFGLGTIPAMMVAPALVRILAAKRRGLVMKVLGIIVIVLGLFTMIRGTGLMHLLHGSGAGHEPVAHQMQQPSKPQGPAMNYDPMGYDMPGSHQH